MENVYEKLLQQLAQMTPEQKAEEWNTLRCFNEMGSEVESYIRAVEGITEGNETLDDEKQKFILMLKAE